MSISDAYVRVMCDVCDDEEECSLPFDYPNLSGAGGRFNHDKPHLPRGWIKDGDMHLCEECAAERRKPKAETTS